MSALVLAVYWGVAAWGLVARRPVLVYLFFATLPLGTLAVIPPGLVGGLSLIAPTMALFLLVVRQVALVDGGLRALVHLMFNDNAGRTLAAFWSVATVVTLFAPRLFIGGIDVIPMSEAGRGAVPLVPTLQNVSQLAYLTVSCFGVLVLACHFRADRGSQLVRNGLWTTALVIVATGLLDLIGQVVPIGFVTEPFKTAEYAISDTQRLANGTRRVVGLMAEPAAFGALTMGILSMLYFARTAYASNDGAGGTGSDRLFRWTLGGLVLMMILSTSSAGYAAIGVLAALAATDWLARASGITVIPLVRIGTRRELSAVLVAGAAVALLAIYWPAVLEPVVGRVDELLLQKTDSDSFDERSLWTRVSFQAGIESSLLGVGLGSTRASNYAVVLFASTGLLGLGLYVRFAYLSLQRRPPSRHHSAAVWARAMKWSFPPLLVIDLLIGTTPDFGTMHALRWGVLLGLATAAGPRASTRTARTGPNRKVLR